MLTDCMHGIHAVSISPRQQCMYNYFWLYTCGKASYEAGQLQCSDSSTKTVCSCDVICMTLYIHMTHLALSVSHEEYRFNSEYHISSLVYSLMPGDGKHLQSTILMFPFCSVQFVLTLIHKRYWSAGQSCEQKLPVTCTSVGMCCFYFWSTFIHSPFVYTNFQVRSQNKIEWNLNNLIVPAILLYCGIVVSVKLHRSVQEWLNVVSKVKGG